MGYEVVYNAADGQAIDAILDSAIPITANMMRSVKEMVD